MRGTGNVGTLYRIRDWDKHFENAGSRKLKRLSYVYVKNKFGTGYCTLVKHTNGGGHLGAWLAILEIASTCNPRGTLCHDDKEPMTTDEIATLSRLPLELIDEALNRLLVKPLRWIEAVEVGDSPNVVADSPNVVGEKSHCVVMCSEVKPCGERRAPKPEPETAAEVMATIGDSCSRNVHRIPETRPL